MSGTRSTFGILQSLLHPSASDIKMTHFVKLAQSYDWPVTDPLMHRAVKAGKFEHATEIALRELVLELEKLVKRFQPLRISIANTEATKVLLDCLRAGLDFWVEPETNSKPDSFSRSMEKI